MVGGHTPHHSGGADNRDGGGTTDVPVRGLFLRKLDFESFYTHLAANPDLSTFELESVSANVHTVGGRMPECMTEYELPPLPYDYDALEP
ncbi:MAG: hypothetical protein ACOCQL_02290, partial [Halolamina sp.]